MMMCVRVGGFDLLWRSIGWSGLKRREIKLFCIFWVRAVLAQQYSVNSLTYPEVAPLDDRLPTRAIIKSAQILKPNDLKIEDL